MGKYHHMKVHQCFFMLCVAWDLTCQACFCAIDCLNTVHITSKAVLCSAVTVVLVFSSTIFLLCLSLAYPARSIFTMHPHCLKYSNIDTLTWKLCSVRHTSIWKEVNPCPFPHSKHRWVWSGFPACLWAQLYQPLWQPQRVQRPARSLWRSQLWKGNGMTRLISV